MKFYLNILLIGARHVPDVTFAARVQIWSTYDHVVDTEIRLLKHETLSMRPHLDILLIRVRHCNVTLAELHLR